MRETKASSAIKIIKLNRDRFLRDVKSAGSTIFGIASAVLLFIDKENLPIPFVINGKLFILFVAIILAYALGDVCTYRKVEVIPGKLYVEYGDLWKSAFPPRKEREQRIVVVHMNTTYDTIIEDSTVECPLVRGETIHGQWIQELKNRDIGAKQIDAAIEKSLKQQNCQPENIYDSAQKPKGNRKEYPIGTIAKYQYDQTVFYCLAFAEFDANNKAHSTRDKMIDAICQVIEYYDRDGQGVDLYITLLGTGMARIEGVQGDENEALKILVNSFSLYEHKLQGKVHIVVYDELRDKVSLEI